MISRWQEERLRHMLSVRRGVHLTGARQCGKIVETWAYHEISALADLTPGLEVSQYRDSNRREVDFIVENRKGDILGIEVKAGTVSSGDFAHLRWFASNLVPHGFVGIVLYTGKDILPFGKNLFAIPMACLAH